MADDYYATYNNTAYNSIESDVCHLVYVGRVEMLRESEVGIAIVCHVYSKNSGKKWET